MITDSELATARRLAHRIASRWTAVSSEDLASELVLWLFENQAAVERWRSEDDGAAKLFVSLKRFAAKACVKEQETRNGAPLEADAAYTLDQLHRAMPYVFEATPQTVRAEHPGTGLPLYSSALSGEHSVALAVMTDVKGAFQDLPDDMKTVLILRYRDGMTYDEIGSLTDVSDRGAQRRVQRALKRMQERLGG